MKKQTLASLFESDKNKLKEQLSGLNLPQDATKIQLIVEGYFNSIFDKDSEYRQSLTQAEDYILQGAMALLNAQQSMIKEFSVKSETIKPTETTERVSQNGEGPRPGLPKEFYPHALVGSALGGAVGGLIIGTWGAVFGSIAGTAVIMYYASEKMSTSKNRMNTPSHKASSTEKIKTKQTLNIDVFFKIIHNICDSIDSLINSFRAQINRVVNQYENQEKPTLEGDYRSLLESIQSLIGFKRAHNENDDKYIVKLNKRIEDLAEDLDAYNIKVVDYNGSNEEMFNRMSSSDVSETKMVTPAFVKNGKVVIKGKVFVKS